jgi:hypothetical protein
MMLWTSVALAAPLALSEVEASVDRWLPTLAIAAAEVDGAEGDLLAARGAFVNVSLFPYGVTALEPFACAPPDRGGRRWCLFWPRRVFLHAGRLASILLRNNQSPGTSVENPNK